MRLGGDHHEHARVFLLSTTHGAESHHLAAAMATIKFYQDNPVVETLYARGEQLRLGVESAVADNGLQGYVDLSSRDCNLLFGTRDAERKASQAFRTLFMQELIRRGVLAPSFVVSFSHSESDIARTVEAVQGALRVYRKGLDSGVEGQLNGRSVKPVFRRFA